MESLRRDIKSAWAAVTEAEVRKATGGFRRRLEEVVAAGGGHIE